MGRYSFLNDKDTYDALNRLRDAFLAAKDGNEVTEIMNGLLTEDEKIRIGRRILIADSLRNEMKYIDIVRFNNIGYTTVSWIAKQMATYPSCFSLILKRRVRMEKEYQEKKYRKAGGSLKVIKTNVYTGLKRSEIKR